MWRKTRLLALCLSMLSDILIIAASVSAQNKPWVTAYYGGWEQGSANNGYLPTKYVDFSAMTVVAHMSLLPHSDGGLDSVSNGINPINSSALISAAHAAGAKVIITVGAWATESDFLVATSSGTLARFVSNIVGFVKERGYDGVDIDWEPLVASDTAQYSNLIGALRNALPSPQYLLTTTTGWGEPYAVFARLQSYFDQINIMTYDLSFPSPGWVTWYNGAVHSNGVVFQSTGAPLPACDDIVALYLKAGVASTKLGIGSELGGFVWKGGVMINGAGDPYPTGSGATGPDQEWEGYLDNGNSPSAPKVTVDVPLYSFDGKTGIMRQYYSRQRYHWDAGAGAAYLSIDSSNANSDYFISYDDSNCIAAKFAFIQQEHLGGIILYELGMGYPGNGTYPLLESIKNDMLKTYPDPPTSSIPPNVSISFPSNGITVSGTLALSASATDPVGVTGVVFKLDGKQVGSIVTSPPYTVLINTAFLSNGTHTISASAIDAAGNSSGANSTVTFSNSAAGSYITLDQNYPNPFNPSTTIVFSIANSQNATLEVVNDLGQTVEILDKGYMAAGRYTIPWNGGDHPSGAYFLVLRTSSGQIVKKMVLIR